MTRLEDKIRLMHLFLSKILTSCMGTETPSTRYRSSLSVWIKAEKRNGEKKNDSKTLERTERMHGTDDRGKNQVTNFDMCLNVVFVINLTLH